MGHPALEREASGLFRCRCPMSRIRIYDTTLRDGSQGEGVNFSLQDKLLITRRLDELGVDFIEGGYPLSNPKDFEYVQEVRKLELRHGKIAAFGMTRRKGGNAADDACMKALIESQAPIITIVGKTWDLHVTEVLNTSLEENLHMIADSIAFCRSAPPHPPPPPPPQGGGAARGRGGVWLDGAFFRCFPLTPPTLSTTPAPRPRAH